MTWVAFLSGLLKILNTLAPVVTIWLAQRAGKKAARTEQAAENARAHKRYEEIEGEPDPEPEEIDEVLRKGKF